jgi:hypothetical protein
MIGNSQGEEKMDKRSIAQVISTIIMILLSACGSNSDVQVYELSNSSDSYEETILMNNCGGKRDSEQTAVRSFTKSIGGEFGIGVRSVVEGEIVLRYSEFQTETRSMRLIAAPGTDMVFVLRWSEGVKAGNVTYKGSTGTYEVRIPISVELVDTYDQGCDGTNPTAPTAVIGAQILPSPTSPPVQMVIQGDGPFRDHRITPEVGTGVLLQGTYSDGMAPFIEADTGIYANIQRIRIEENPDGCAIANYTVDKIWFGSAVRTELTINGSVVGMINGPTSKHGYIFNVNINRGDIICVTYFEPSGFQIIFGPDLYYHYDSYCYRGHCN